MTFAITYRSPDRPEQSFEYDRSGFPWWTTTCGTRYATREEAETTAAQLRLQRARAGEITVEERG